MTEFEAAQNEENGQGPVFDVGGRTIIFRPSLPIGVASAVQREDFDLLVEILATGSVFADPQSDDPPMKRFLELNLPAEDFDKVAGLYGLDAGNLPASPGS